jgi:TPR repeat protein
MKRLLVAFVLLPLLLCGAEPDSPAVARLRARALQGYPGAQSNLGDLYANGYGVSKDDVEAASWYLKAAKQGYGEAEFNVGLAFLEGKGVPKDAVEGLAWVTLAARPGTVSLVRFREKLENDLGPEVAAAAQRRSKELLKLIEVNKRAKAG